MDCNLALDSPDLGADKEGSDLFNLADSVLEQRKLHQRSNRYREGVQFSLWHIIKQG
ncbi:hypothetical protein B0H10DRAFT_2097052 [Mycena sp. CBHHK59/15]|nr:hypothetical protein B0H10DRAFT_2097052 [Mycena sp. CBHHK59/15]